ncbi:MAG: DMT family transporter [Gammaproteobacteria bacterium]
MNALLALVCGALIALQAATNAVLFRSLENVVWSAAVLLAVGLCVLLLAAAATGAVPPAAAQFKAAPAWAYTGGIVVATYVVVITFLVPKIGVGNAVVLIVAGQIMAAVLFDHFGLFGVEQKLMDIKRAAGIVLLTAGVYLART